MFAGGALYSPSGEISDGRFGCRTHRTGTDQPVGGLEFR
jgi:hypothetical protein